MDATNTPKIPAGHVAMYFAYSPTYGSSGFACTRTAARREVIRRRAKGDRECHVKLEIMSGPAHYKFISNLPEAS